MGKKTDRGSKKKKGNKGNRQGQSTSRTMNGQTYTPPMASDTDASETEEEPSPSRRSSGTRTVERKPSPVLAPLPRLTNEEYAFFDKVKSGDVAGVEATLGNMDINKANRDGYTVLHIAVSRQDEAMVDLLLNQPGIKMYDTILHAIKESNLSITQKLLAVHDKVDSEEKKELFMSYIGQATPEMRTGSDATTPTVPLTSVQPGIISSVLTDETRKGFSKPKPARSTTIEHVPGERKHKFDSEYHPVITPLMIAAQVGSYPLMELFYERGERLESSEYHHNLSCACDTCKKLEGDADLTKAYERFHLFNSITQPLYICFMGRREKIDPVNYAISKIIKLRKMIERDLAFGGRYTPFIERLETFMTDLIEQCRDTHETEIFLSPKDPEGRERLPHLHPRLWYTVGLEMTKFVAHANTQNIVHKIWMSDWPEWDTLGTFNRCFQLLMRIIGFPFVAVILLFAQNTRLGKKLRAPVSRFLTFMGSYICFLLVVTIQVYLPKQRCNHGFLTSLVASDESGKECKERGPPNIGTEWFIGIYVMSFYICILKRSSVSWYWSVRWNWFDLVGQFVFTATIGCWLWALIWTYMPENQLLIDATERLMWPHNCAEVFADCLMSLASVFAYGQLLRFSLVMPLVGPMQIGLGRLIMDFVGALLIYLSILVAFASGMLAVYVPYMNSEGITLKGKFGKVDATFTKFHTAMADLFWYLHGHKEAFYRTLSLPVWTHSNFSGWTGEEIHHTYTEKVGHALFFSFHVIGGLLMFQMLTGHFSDKWNEMTKDMETHWKFARTELYLTFIKDTVLPPPFNLSPTVVGCVNVGKFCRYIGKNDDPKAACSAKQCCYITGSGKSRYWKDMFEKYRPLIVELMYRYGSFKEQQEAEAKATKDHVKDIQEELAELKALLQSKKRGSGTLGGESSPDNVDNFPPRPRKTWAKPRRMLAIGGANYIKRKVFKEDITTVLPAPAPQLSRTVSTEPGLLEYASSPSEPPLRRTPSLPHPSSKTKLPVATPSPQEGTAPSQPSPSRTSPIRKDSASARSKPSPSRTSPKPQGSPHSQPSPSRTSSTPKKIPSTAPLEKKVSSKTLGGTSGKAPPTPPPMPRPISMTSMTTDDSEPADGKRHPR